MTAAGTPSERRGGVTAARQPGDAVWFRSFAPLLAILALLGCVLAFGAKLPCRAGAWNIPGQQFRDACYTDIYPLYFVEGLSDGKVPYLDQPVEYPVVIGGVMQAVALAVRPLADPFARGRAFFDLTVVLLAVAAIVAVLATGYTLGRSHLRRASMVALAPALIATAFINWDLLAVALTALAFAAWAGRRPAVAGVFLGLAIATKFYPVLFLGPLFLLSLRAGRLRAFGWTLAASALAWLVADLPVLLAAPAGFGRFYSFSRERPADWGSIFYLFQTERVPVLGSSEVGRTNLFAFGAFGVACLGIALLALAAPRRPRLAQLAFLVLAAFLVTNKVWSPQYVLWLLPLAVLARPRLPAYLLWQVAEIGYFLAVWYYLLHVTTQGQEGIGTGPYFAALLARSVAVLVLSGLVVAEILRPERDAVRVDGADDPGGGVLDGAPDRFVLVRNTT